MTEQELDECLRMFSIHPSKRGGWNCEPPPAAVNIIHRRALS